MRCIRGVRLHVTGDKDLLRLGRYDALLILTVSDFLELAMAEGREHSVRPGWRPFPRVLAPAAAVFSTVSAQLESAKIRTGRFTGETVVNGPTANSYEEIAQGKTVGRHSPGERACRTISTSTARASALSSISRGKGTRRP